MFKRPSVSNKSTKHYSNLPNVALVHTALGGSDEASLIRLWPISVMMMTGVSSDHTTSAAATVLHSPDTLVHYGGS